MSTDFPEIPSTEELMRDADAALQETNTNGHGDYNPEQNGTSVEAADSGQYNQVEPFRANPPYMINRPDWTPNEYKEPPPGLAELKKAYTDIPLEQRRRPVFEIQHQGQTVELSPLVKAYARFTSEQTLFLETGGSLTPEQYQQALRRYSGEQSRLIRAQAEALRQAGIL